MQTATDKDRQSDIGERLILLVEKKKSASAVESVYRLVRIEFEAIRKAREELVSWREIAETCGVPGKESLMRNAFRLERSRREKKKESPAQEVPEEKQEPQAKTQKPENRKTEKKDPEVKYKSSFNIDDESD